MIGAGTRVEVWDRTTWETYLAEQESSYSETAEQIFPDLQF